MSEAAPKATGASSEEEPHRKKVSWRALLAYWILGLCNNYGYVVMLTAASDIISRQEEKKKKVGERECTMMATGAILLADIIPCVAIKLFAPFIPFFATPRVAVCIVLAAAGFILVGLGNIWVIMTGVICTSLGSGLGEITYLQYSNYYDKNVVSTWSSGTGGAGVVGATSYALLQLIGFRTTLFIMLIVPVTMGLVFFVLLPKPEPVEEKVEIQKQVNVEEVKKPKEVLIKKIRLIPSICYKYMLPFFLVYVFEYFINQGTFELVDFRNTVLKRNDQYRWLQVAYQFGVLISRSSVNLFYIKFIWIFAILQGINIIFFTTHVIYFWIPYYWIVVMMTLWEGLLGGAAYVNTFYKIANEVIEEEKQFTMAITSFSDSIGISLAGCLAIVAHNAICLLPLPEHEKKLRNITNATHH